MTEQSNSTVLPTNTSMSRNLACVKNGRTAVCERKEGRKRDRRRRGWGLVGAIWRQRGAIVDSLLVTSNSLAAAALCAVCSTRHWYTPPSPSSTWEMERVDSKPLGSYPTLPEVRTTSLRSHVHVRGREPCARHVSCTD